MNQPEFAPYRQRLRHLMDRSGIASLSELGQRSGLSNWQLHRLEWGLMPKVSVETAIALANALHLSLEESIRYFWPDCPPLSVRDGDREVSELDTLNQEYQRLERQLQQQRESLEAEFQQSSLEAIESWLLQWPTAAAAAQNNPDLPAFKLLALVKPIGNLLKRWGVEAIGSVGEMTAYDPQFHELMEGTLESGEAVCVRYLGYQQGDKLLYRAKVSPIPLEDLEAATEEIERVEETGAVEEVIEPLEEDWPGTEWS